MTSIRIAAVLLAAAASAGTLAQQAPVATGAAAVAPGAAIAIQTTRASALVVGIDAASRTVTLKRADGRVFDLTAGEQVRNFAQIRLGDRVVAEYTEALTLELVKGGTGIRERSEAGAAARAPEGAKPAGAAGRRITILANVVGVDRAKKTVTLRGPAGNVVDLKVDDPAQLANVKKGDQVEAVYTEAVAVSVEAAGPARK